MSFAIETSLTSGLAAAFAWLLWRSTQMRREVDGQARDREGMQSSPKTELEGIVVSAQAQAESPPLVVDELAQQAQFLTDDLIVLAADLRRFSETRSTLIAEQAAEITRLKAC